MIVKVESPRHWKSDPHKGPKNLCTFYSQDLSGNHMGRRQLTGWGQAEPKEARKRTKAISPTQSDRFYKSLEFVTDSPLQT